MYLPGAVAVGMQRVKTKYVLVLQHDLPFIRHVDMHNVVRSCPPSSCGCRGMREASQRLGHGQGWGSW